MQMVNLDTHVLIHALAGDLRPTEERLLTSNEWGIAAIVLWELAKLQQLGRVELDFDEPDVDAALACLHVWPLDLAVARMSTQLDFSADPADELIAATSIVHDVPLVTRDRRIRSTRRVPLAKTR